jgi:putative acetyltransferase
MIRIRNYDDGDAMTIVRLFYDTIHSINQRDYSVEQVQAWAPEIPDAQLWHNRMIARYTLVADQAGELLGFGELEAQGHLDMLYCRSDVVGRGVGRRLYDALEAKARTNSLRCIFAEVSITARPFFLRCGFNVIQPQTVFRRGVSLTNFKMTKSLVQLAT